MAFEFVSVGKHRILLTAFNNTSDLSLLACRFLVERIVSREPEIPETEFRDWVARLDGGTEFLALLDRGAIQPNSHDLLELDPLNAHQEARCVSYLLDERRSQGRERSRGKGVQPCPHCGKSTIRRVS